MPYVAPRGFTLPHTLHLYMCYLFLTLAEGCLSGMPYGRSQICPRECPSLLTQAVIPLVQLILLEAHFPRLWSLKLPFQVTAVSTTVFYHTCCVRRESARMGAQAPLVNPISAPSLRYMWMGACCESQGAYKLPYSFPCDIRS